MFFVASLLILTIFSGSVPDGATNTGGVAKNTSTNTKDSGGLIDKSYQIQQKKTKKSYSVGTFYDAKSRRYFKAKYRLISKDLKKKISWKSAAAAPATTSSSSKSARSRVYSYTPPKQEKKQHKLTKEEINKLIEQYKKKKKK